MNVTSSQTPFAGSIDSDTIVAISTPPGRGGIGIVRLSGPDALSLAPHLLQLAHSLAVPEAHARAYFARVLDPAAPARALDDCLVTAFHAPRSYTAEPLVEIATHGSPVILDALLRNALATGQRLGLSVRLANPGEFTQRAFLAGRIDLTQAEAVHDLIAAHTLDQARVAAQQLGGALSRRVAPIKGDLLHIIALLEAGMDFASGELDDVDVVPPTQIADFIGRVRSPLEVLAATYQRGQLLRNGAAIAIVGRPNAGKSSLFNRLLERDRAIVTAIPGTTRDTLEESLSLGGIPVRLIDTAGLRTTAADEAEQHGIARTRETLADADLILLVHDATQPFGSSEQQLLASIASRPHLLVSNKIDLATAGSVLYPLSSIPSLRTSALTGEGLDALRTAILTQLNAQGSLAESGLINNLRQQQSIADTLTALAAAAEANGSALPHELILVDLHNALRALDSLTGTTTTDDILARIFSTFCIGK
ncbi:tRNA uridine-5-carboxymethylaminomethyl(34) synthesis GTPase MnmE [Granulicella sp. 5B5]|uniref:tRNA uridine-5-carboxymethylaminomethyl(34) synthesis GTPase MnmE n=1 Tax=Granulicella sp. 5B5 TaxID=1617967 RepID=UPI0015F51BC6|nr:tRNA uridine-5-carboxymethylaminomethyl(34) synthesis GTPase MnmE [Granulicella sp. 5B5]QMV18766.1 tRNA uridine-5-carboxymethylaminomethyl(34) synthesis GTPase MnmE [Granulicella sp. 5B5]